MRTLNNQTVNSHLSLSYGLSVSNEVIEASYSSNALNSLKSSKRIKVSKEVIIGITLLVVCVSIPFVLSLCGISMNV
jgi:hypothetical protein